MTKYTKIIHDNGIIEYFKNGKLHRKNGPAYINGDFQVWYKNGKRHRKSGPAIINGDHQVWYLSGKELTEEEFNLKKEKI